MGGACIGIKKNQHQNQIDKVQNNKVLQNQSAFLERNQISSQKQKPQNKVQLKKNKDLRKNLINLSSISAKVSENLSKNPQKQQNYKKNKNQNEKQKQRITSFKQIDQQNTISLEQKKIRSEEYQNSKIKQEYSRNKQNYSTFKFKQKDVQSGIQQTQKSNVNQSEDNRQNDIQKQRIKTVYSDIIQETPLKQVYTIQQYQAKYPTTSSSFRKSVQIEYNNKGSDISCQNNYCYNLLKPFFG